MAALEYHADPAWQPVESFDKDTEIEECYLDDCRGLHYSDGSEKVCGTCGHAPRADGLQASDCSAAEDDTHDWRETPLPFVSNSDRPRYSHSRRARMSGGFRHAHADDIAELDEGLLDRTVDD